MRSSVAATLVFTLAFNCGAARAAEFYAGLDYQYMTFQTPALVMPSGGSNLSAIQLRLGMEFTEHLSIEVRYASPLSDDTLPSVVDPITVALDPAYGVFLHFSFWRDPDWDTYVVAGHSSATVTADSTLPFADQEWDLSGLSFGVGASRRIGDAGALVIEWIPSVGENPNAELDAVILGWNFSF